MKFILAAAIAAVAAAKQDWEYSQTGAEIYMDAVSKANMDAMLAISELPEDTTNAAMICMGK